ITNASDESGRKHQRTKKSGPGAAVSLLVIACYARFTLVQFRARGLFGEWPRSPSIQCLIAGTRRQFPSNWILTIPVELETQGLVRPRHGGCTQRQDPGKEFLEAREQPLGPPGFGRSQAAAALLFIE